MTMQTSEPLTRSYMTATQRPVGSLLDTDEYDVNPSYQRPSVWTYPTRAGLVASLVRGLPIPAIIVSKRFDSAYSKANPDYNGSTYAVIDGKQRTETIRAWLNGDLPVPASWFPTDDVMSTTPTDDGDYVTFSGLSISAQRRLRNAVTVSIVETDTCTSEADEAALYVLLNGAGVAQADETMAHAAQIAQG